ncbi:MAG TPA: glycosyltransferase [Candidatus Limnocylindria bacterium]
MRAPSAGTPLSALTAVIPVRNAERFIDDCLRSVLDEHPAAVIVVDGLSTDKTVEIAKGYGVPVLSDGGLGVAAARLIGAEAASTEWVALIDADVVLPPGSLRQLFEEVQTGGYSALQAGLESTSGPGYWGRALVDHHRSGRSRYWFGLVATIFERSTLLTQGLDASFASGEDIEIRWRLERSGAKIGVSDAVVVEHRFADTFQFALGQFLADGAGLARMAMKHGWRALPLLALPSAAALRGAALSLIRRQPRWIPYYVVFLAANSFAIGRQLLRQIRRRG